MTRDLDMPVPGEISGLVLAFLVGLLIPKPQDSKVEKVVGTASDVKDLFD